MRRGTHSIAYWVLGLVTALAAGCAKEEAKPTTAPVDAADTIYVGGDIVTIDDARPTAAALAVKDGQIVAVGARPDVEKAHKGEATRVVDLGGKTQMLYAEAG